MRKSFWGMDQKQMAEMIKEKQTRSGDRMQLIHSHQLVTGEIRRACVNLRCGSICVACGRRWKQRRMKRIGCIWAQSVEDAVEYLQNTEGKILITTGSKELIKYTKLTEYKRALLCASPSLRSRRLWSRYALGFEGNASHCNAGTIFKGDDRGLRSIRQAQNIL